MLRPFFAFACAPALALLLAGCTPTPTPPPFDPAAEAPVIHALIQQQQEDWNAGDIDAFMTAYWQSDSLRFASGGAVQQGWQNTLDRYNRTYGSRDAMGTLAFSDLDVRVLSPDWALGFGRWHLSRTGGFEDIGGLFTLVFEKGPDGWRIVHDHTSQ